MLIRDVNKKDFEKLNELFMQIDFIHSEAHPDLFNQPVKHARSDEYLISIFQNDKQKLIVAIEDNMIVGLAIAAIESAPDVPLFKKRMWLTISTIIVDEDHRGKGIGKMLLGDLYRWAKKKNINEVELTVFAFNESAIEFYKKNGFRDIRTKMRKNISDYNKK
ncbi:MAG: GNAT family N-acetyltransferase [Candidatus Izemoplasma sp.]